MKFEKFMQDSLQETVKPIVPSELLRAKVMTEIQTQRALLKPRRSRYLVTAAAVIAVFVTGAFAASPVVGWMSSTSANGQYQTLEKETEIENVLGFSVQVPEALQDLPFKNISADKVEGFDENYQAVTSFLEMTTVYGTDEQSVFLIGSQHMDTEDTKTKYQNVQTREINGISVTYREMLNITYPPDVEIPQEELDAQERGECWISVGTETRQETIFSFISWVQNGVQYQISAHSNQCDWTADDYFAAAQSVINTPA